MNINKQKLKEYISDRIFDLSYLPEYKVDCQDRIEIIHVKKMIKQIIDEYWNESKNSKKPLKQ